MLAQIGDRIVLEGTHLNDARRTGLIVAVAHADGSPPYEVRWLDTGRTTFIFPGPEARIEHREPAGEASEPSP